MKHKSGVNPTNWSIMSFARQNYCGLPGRNLSPLPFSQKAVLSELRRLVENELMTAAACLGFLSVCLIVSPPITVGCGQQRHHFSWQHFNKSWIIVTQRLLSIPFSLINSLTLSPSPHLCYRPSLHVDVDVLPLADRDSPSGYVWLFTWPPSLP